jgi:hypothetical protein
MPSAAQALFCLLFWASKRVRRSRGAQPPDLCFAFDNKLTHLILNELVFLQFIPYYSSTHPTRINKVVLLLYQHIELLTGKDPQAKMPSLFAGLKNCIQYTDLRRLLGAGDSGLVFCQTPAPSPQPLPPLEEL